MDSSVTDTILRVVVARVVGSRRRVTRKQVYVSNQLNSLVIRNLIKLNATFYREILSTLYNTS